MKFRQSVSDDASARVRTMVVCKLGLDCCMGIALPRKIEVITRIVACNYSCKVRSASHCNLEHAAHRFAHASPHSLLSKYARYFDGFARARQNKQSSWRRFNFFMLSTSRVTLEALPGFVKVRNSIVRCVCITLFTGSVVSGFLLERETSNCKL